MISETSKQAYHDIKDLKDREEKVLAYIREHPGATAHDIVYNIGMQHRNVCSRLSDLSARCKIEVVGRKRDEITGRQNNQYKIAQREPFQTTNRKIITAVYPHGAAEGSVFVFSDCDCGEEIQIIVRSSDAGPSLGSEYFVCCTCGRWSKFSLVSVGNTQYGWDLKFEVSEEEVSESEFGGAG